MGGGSEFPAEMIKGSLNGPVLKTVKEPTKKNWEEKQHNQKDRKQRGDIKIMECDKKEKEKKKDEVIEVMECSKLGEDKRQQESIEVVKGTEENRRQTQSRDEGGEKRKDREEERRKRNEMVMNGWEKNRIEEWERAEDKGKVLEELDGGVEGKKEKKLKDKEKRAKDHVKAGKKERKELTESEKENVCTKDEGKTFKNPEGTIEGKVEKKHKEREKTMKDHTKKGKNDKKEITLPEGENNHRNDELLDKKVTHKDKQGRTQDKGWYNVDKLKNKLAKLDAKMEKIAAKSEIYLQRLHEAEKSCAHRGGIIGYDLKEPIVDRLANKMDLPNVPSLLKTDLPDGTTKGSCSELHENISESVLYPKLEEKDMTGVGY